MADKKRIISIIKKLFLLANSPNENEAQLALMKAHDLLKKYNIEESELDDDYIQENYNVNNVIEKSIGIVYLRLPIYKDILAATIAHIFDCESIRDYPYYDKSSNKMKHTICFVGFPVDVEIAIFAFNFTLKFIDSHCRKRREEYKKKHLVIPKNFKLSYTCGFIDNIEKKLEILKKYKQKEEMEKVSKYDKLLAVKENALVEYLNEIIGNVDNTSKELSVNQTAYLAGSEDAKKFNINIPVNGNNNFSEIQKLC